MNSGWVFICKKEFGANASEVVQLFVRVRSEYVTTSKGFHRVDNRMTSVKL